MKNNNQTKSNWKYYSIELAVVFIGVTAGFILNSWRETKNDLELEHKYLTSFYSDIQEDERNLDSLIISSNTKVDTFINIIKKTEVNNVPLSEKMAQSIVNQIIYIDWFSPTNDTYGDIKNSGNLNLISDYKLKEKISSYYKFINEVKNVEQYYKEHINNYALPFIYKNYHLFKKKFIDNKSYLSLEFTNMYLGLVALIQENNRTYKKALSKNQELKSSLMTILDINE